MIRALIGVLALVLAGCASQPTQTPAGGNGAPILDQIGGFELRGRVGVRTAADGFSGTLLWRQAGDDVSLSVFGALGLGRVDIDGDAHSVIIRSARLGEQRFDAPEQALERAYGWSLPLSSLRYWVLGTPDPRNLPSDLGYAADHGPGVLGYLVQDGWRVDYADYDLQGDWLLPSRLAISRADVKVRLIVKDWLLLDAISEAL